MPKIIGRISFYPTPDDPFADLLVNDAVIEEPPAELNLTVDEAAAERLRISVQQANDPNWPTDTGPEAA